MKRAMHICSFSSGLDEMPNKAHRDPREVLLHLHGVKRFSAFEATCTPAMARSIDYLTSMKLIETDPSPGYPWLNVTVTPKGLKWAGISPTHSVNEK
jgi:hypothetical protein